MLNKGLLGCTLYMNKSALMSKGFSLMDSESCWHLGGYPGLWAPLNLPSGSEWACDGSLKSGL